jgi:hypothetical protein
MADDSYWNALYETFTSPAQTLASITGGATESSEPAGGTSGEASLSLANAVAPNLTQAQADALQSQETAELIQAGMDPEDAQAQAQSDVNAALTSAGAAPSQAWYNNLPGGLSATTWLYILAAGAIGLALLYIFLPRLLI